MDTNKIFIDMAQRAHEFAEMCNRVANESNAVKEDPEAWRERNRQRQAAGVKFEWRNEGIWRRGYKGSIFTFDIGGEEDYREVPQEASNVKETGVCIPEASRNILIAWQRSGLKFLETGEPVNFPLKFDCTMKGNYTIPEQPIPKGMSVETVEAMWQQGLKLEFASDLCGWNVIGDKFNWPSSGAYQGSNLINRLRIPAQPIPEKLLEVPQEVFASECQKAALEHLAKTYSADKGAAQLNPPPLHAAERALWKAQREAGTNEVWQGKGIKIVTDWFELDAVAEPPWHPDFTYRVKPMKLTAKIVRWAYGSKVQDWEFYGTPEEYRAECEKYGYAVVGEIKEVVEKPKTVKNYSVLVRLKFPTIEAANDYVKDYGIDIIGDIEEREIEV